MNGPSIAVTESRAPATLHRTRILVQALTGTVAVELDDQVVDLAVSEGVAAWLGARVAQARASVPGPRAGQLVWEHQMCLASNLVRARAGLAFVDRCRRAGIPVAWLKGMAMIDGIVEPGARSMGDVDLLVPASRWHEACDMANDVPGAGMLIPTGRTFTAAHDYVRAFSLPSGVTLEIHRFVCEASLFNIDHEGPDGLFARAACATSGLSVLEEGDLFLTLAAHAAKHTFELPLRSFLDGIVLLQRGRLDLDHLLKRAKRWRMEKAFCLWLQCLFALAPSMPGGDVVAPPTLAGPIWSRTAEASAWQRFLRLAWITDRASDWARHVITRAVFRLCDVVDVRRPIV